MLHISPYESIGDKMVIFLAAKGLLFVSVRSNALLLLSVRSSGCFSPSQRGPIVLEGDSDMVRYPCMLSLWVDSCPEAVCEALMVPHFHWGKKTTIVFFFLNNRKNNQTLVLCLEVTGSVVNKPKISFCERIFVHFTSNTVKLFNFRCVSNY